MPLNLPDVVAHRLKTATRVVALTGGGMAAESKVPSFREAQVDAELHTVDEGVLTRLVSGFVTSLAQSGRHDVEEITDLAVAALLGVLEA